MFRLWSPVLSHHTVLQVDTDFNPDDEGWYLPTWLQCVKTQEITIWTNTAMKTSKMILFCSSTHSFTLSVIYPIKTTYIYWCQPKLRKLLNLNNCSTNTTFSNHSIKIKQNFCSYRKICLLSEAFLLGLMYFNNTGFKIMLRLQLSL
jgi:hypothetical protein